MIRRAVERQSSPRHDTAPVRSTASWCAARIIGTARQRDVAGDVLPRRHEHDGVADDRPVACQHHQRRSVSRSFLSTILYAHRAVAGSPSPFAYGLRFSGNRDANRDRGPDAIDPRDVDRPAYEIDPLLHTEKSQ